MFKNLMRCVAMFAAVIVSTDAFAQAQVPLRQGGLLNRGNRQAAARQQAAAPAGRPTEASADQGGGDASAVNMDGAPVEMVLKIYGELVGKTIIVAPEAEGQLNKTIKFKSAPGQKLSDEERILAYETILEMNQIHLEAYGDKFMRALPRKDVRKEGIPLIMDSDSKIGDTTRVVSMMVQLKNISTEDGQKTLDNFRSASGIIIAFERTNSILITDTEANINRMLEIVHAIDVAMPVLENVFVRQIKNASAADIKTALEAIVQESQKELEKSGNKNAANVAQPGSSPRPSIFNRNNNQKTPEPVANSSVLMQVSDADRGMIRGKVLILADERSNKLVIVTQKPNMDFFDKVIEQLDVETTPDTVVKVYRLKYAEAEEVSDMINDLIGNSGSSRSSSKGSQNANSKQGGGSNITRGGNTAAGTSRGSANKRTGEAKAGELTKDNTTVLADKRINGLIVMTEKELVSTIEQIIESMDIKLSQVLIETAIIEVSLGDDLVTGVDWVNQNWTATGGYSDRGAFGGGGGGSGGSALGSLSGHGSGKSYSDWATEARQVLLGSSATGSSAGTLTTEEIDDYIKSATASSISPIGSGINYFLKLDKLNLDVVIAASKTDSRTKYVASPIVMTLDNKEATIEATQARKFLSNYQSSSASSYYGSSVVPQYENKDIGIKIKVTPKINPNGTVMLNVEEEYSQVGAKQTILDPDSQQVAIDTALTRKMSADALLENLQTIVLCGLTETSTVEQETGIPILKDIPWVGKWLFGSVQQTEARSELIIFMTPYVLNDAESAQAEALRRKKTLSDPSPWDDHGWSASSLADPVSKKEQLRRLKAEWKKQDEERKSKIAIETEKVDRVKKLEKMSKDEREVWLEMHKEELEEEQKEELEKKMLDEGSQGELRKLVEEVKSRKLEEAEKAIEKSEKEAAQDNERAKLDAAKAAKEAESKPKEE